MSKNIFKNFNNEIFESLQEDAKAQGVHVVHSFAADDAYGGVSVAWKRSAGHKNSRMICVSTSYCSDKDQFCKRIGSYNALNNFFNGHTIMIPIGGTNEDIVRSIRVMFYYGFYE